jgi:hypothetical protein
MPSEELQVVSRAAHVPNMQPVKLLEHHRNICAYLAIGDSQMLWTIFVILLVLWLLGWIGFHALGAFIHIVLVLALIVLCIQLFSGRRNV